jgi:hypothetical protein
VKKQANKNVLPMKRLTHEYEAIQQFYGADRAKRSGVLLMNHIDEGIDMLRIMGASELAIDAYCLHPIIQDEAIFKPNWKLLIKDEAINLDALYLARSYRNAANAYLCRPGTDHFTLEDLRFHVGFLSQDLVHMLFADKIQNERDFNQYHKGKHARSRQLTKYFALWLDYLEELDEEHRKERQLGEFA